MERKFAFEAEDTIEWVAAYCVDLLIRGALRSLTILLAPPESKVDELKPCPVIGCQNKLSLLESSDHSGIFAFSVPRLYLNLYHSCLSG